MHQIYSSSDECSSVYRIHSRCASVCPVHRFIYRRTCITWLGAANQKPGNGHVTWAANQEPGNLFLAMSQRSQSGNSGDLFLAMSHRSQSITIGECADPVSLQDSFVVHNFIAFCLLFGNELSVLYIPADFIWIGHLYIIRATPLNHISQSL